MAGTDLNDAFRSRGCCSPRRRPVRCRADHQSGFLDGDGHSIDRRPAICRKRWHRTAASIADQSNAREEHALCEAANWARVVSSWQCEFRSPAPQPRRAASSLADCRHRERRAAGRPGSGTRAGSIRRFPSASWTVWTGGISAFLPCASTEISRPWCRAFAASRDSSTRRPDCRRGADGTARVHVHRAAACWLSFSRSLP